MAENQQLRLFEQAPPDIALTPAQRQQLATLIEALLSEIATAVASGETGDDQNHG